MAVVHDVAWVTMMCLIAVLPFVAAATACLVYLCLHLRLMAAYRQAIRPQAERIAIEKRWLERWSRSRADFAHRWDAERRALYGTHVARRHRYAFGLGDFERALDAELAGLTNREIASWTFADRASRSQDGFERVLKAGLEGLGWSVSARIGEAHRILTRGRHRVALRFHFDGAEAACLDVEAIARRAHQTGCDAACIVTNGRTRGATRVFAEAFGVTLLHSSQLDLLDGLRRMSAPFETRMLAAA